jgi:hypothetical protein
MQHFLHPLKSVKIGRALLETSDCENLLKNVAFTKCKVKRVVNLFEDTGSVRELNYLAKISRSCFSPLWKN